MCPNEIGTNHYGFHLSPNREIIFIHSNTVKCSLVEFLVVHYFQTNRKKWIDEICFWIWLWSSIIILFWRPKTRLQIHLDVPFIQYMYTDVIWFVLSHHFYTEICLISRDIPSKKEEEKTCTTTQIMWLFFFAEW